MIKKERFKLFFSQFEDVAKKRKKIGKKRIMKRQRIKKGRKNGIDEELKSLFCAQILRGNVILSIIVLFFSLLFIFFLLFFRLLLLFYSSIRRRKILFLSRIFFICYLFIFLILFFFYFTFLLFFRLFFPQCYILFDCRSKNIHPYSYKAHKYA